MVSEVWSASAVISEARFPSYIFAVGGAGKRTVLGMFGYDYERRTFRDRSHFDWLISSLIRANKSFNVCIMDTETNTKQKDIEICNEMNMAVGEVRNRQSGYTGNVVFSAINLEPPTGYSYETIGGKNSIDVIKRYLTDNKQGKYYWINTIDGEYGDVDIEIFKRVNDLFSINTLELSAGVQRNRAVTKALWYYFLKNIGKDKLPNLRDEKIAIFGGLGGGSGSTLIVELSRKYSANNEVYIFGILPAINGESQQSNTCGYITLTELERLSITNPEFRNHTHVILVPLNFVPLGISIPTSGEVQDKELKEDFPLSVLYLVLSVFRQVTGGEHALLPAGVDFKMVRPFILAPTYLIEVIGSSKIEEDFRNTFSEIKKAIRSINQFIQKHFGVIKEFSAEPKLETYIELIRLFKTELRQIEIFIDLYKVFGSKSVESLVKIVKDEYLKQLRKYFEEIEQVIDKFGISESAQKELLNKSLNYYPVLVTIHNDVLIRIGKFEFSDLDKLFFEVLMEWISNLQAIVNCAEKIEKFISESKISSKFWGLLFLSSDKSMVEDLISSLQLQIGNLTQKRGDLEIEIRKLVNIKANLIQNLKSSKELNNLVLEIKDFRKEKDILCNRSTIENFRRFLEEYLGELKRKDKKYILKYEGNLANGAILLENEIKLRSGEYGKHVDNFLNLLEIAQKYDPNKILSREKYMIQLIRAFTHRYHSLMSKRTFKIFGGSGEHKERKGTIEMDIKRDYTEGFSLFYITQHGELDVALTVKGEPLINYLEEIARKKEYDLENKMRDLLNKMNITTTLSELKFESIDDLIRQVSRELDEEITNKQTELEKLLKQLTSFEEFRMFGKVCIDYNENITSRLKELQEKLGKSQQELCDQYNKPKLKYTVTIQRRGELADLLKDEETCKVLTSYLENQIRCFLKNHPIYLGFRECPIRYQNMGISFDKVFAILGTPVGTREHKINREPLVEVISGRIYHGGDFNLNYRRENTNVVSYDITRGNIISITLLFVGVCLDNISYVEKYYKENFEKMFETATDAIYIKYVYDLENGKFYVRRLVDISDLGRVYVKNELESINRDILTYYEERSYLRKQT